MKYYLTGVLGVFVVIALQLAAVWNGSPETSDEHSYYFWGRGNIKHLRQFVSPLPEEAFRKSWDEERLPANTSMYPKFLTHSVHTLFALLAGPDYRSMSRLNALLGIGYVLLLVLALRMLMRVEALRDLREFKLSRAGWLVMILGGSLSGIELFYVGRLSPRIVGLFMVALTVLMYFRYLARPSLKRATWVGLAASFATTAHLMNAIFVAPIFLVEGLEFLKNWRGSRQNFGFIRPLLVILLCLPVGHLVAEIITRIPLLWIEDPESWRFSNYFGQPYQSHFGQFAFYFSFHKWSAQVIGADYTSIGEQLWSRFRELVVIPLSLYGPLILIAACAWVRYVIRWYREGWNRHVALLVLGPSIPLVGWVLFFRLQALSYVMAPVDVYLTLLTLSGISLLVTFRMVRWPYLATLGRLVLVSLLGFQLAHLYPLLSEPATYARATQWLRDQDEHQIAGINCAKGFQAMGISGWHWRHYPGPGGIYGVGDENISPSRRFKAWGLRPDLVWSEDSFPRYFCIENRSSLDDEVVELLKTRGIDVEQPVFHAPAAEGSSFPFARLRGIIVTVLAPYYEFPKVDLEDLRKDWGVFIYEADPYKKPDRLELSRH